MVLPDLSGHEVLRRIKADPALGGVSVVMMTAQHRDVARQAEGLDAGAEDYLIRPVSNDELLARVRTYLRHRELLDRLHASETRFRRLFQDAATGIAVTTPEGRFLEANAAYCRMMGYSPEELREKTFVELTHPEDRARNLELIRELLDGKRESVVIEKRYLTKTGDTVWGRVSVAAQRDERGRPATLIAVTEDITRQRTTEEALRENRRMLMTLMDNLPGMVYRCHNDRDWTMTFVSEGAHRLTGYAPADFTRGKVSFGALIHPDDRERVWAQVQAALRNDQPFELIYRIHTAAGAVRWVRERGQAVRSPEGDVRALEGFISDITEEKKAHEVLRISEERFRLLSKATNDAVWDWNLVTDEVWWNEGFETLFGYRRDEVEPTSASRTRRIHPEDHDRIVPAVRQAIEQGETYWSGEYRFRRKDGTYAYVLDRGYIMRDPEGRPVRMIGGMTDLTERRQAEQHLAEQATLIDQASDAILVCDLDYRVRLWNHGAERIYGWQAAEVEGTPLTRRLFENPDELHQVTAIVLEKGTWSGEMKHRTRNGTTVTVFGRWTLVRDEFGRPKSILAINTDITERKKLEQQVLRAQRMESIGTLAGGIAHDLNNVLAPILLSIELLKMDEPSEERRLILEDIEANARRGADMVRQVLTFARGDEGRRIPIDVAGLVRDVRKIVQDTFPKDIRFNLVLPEGLWTVLGDPTQLHQVLMNLCVNARDAMPEGGTLTITLENTVLDEVYAGINPQARPGPYVVIVVEDTGVGIPSKLQDRIFEPFFTTKEVGKGTGLGLSTSLSIVTRHGGFINVYSEPGRGSRFKVYLPARVEPAMADAAAVEQSRLPRGQGETVLVVDDEESIRSAVKRTLERFGYRVLLAGHGAEAVSLYARHGDTIDVILTDMAMPVMDGPATIVALKALDPNVRIIGSSGLGGNGHVAKAAEAGVRHFIPKPYTADALLTTLHAVLSETS